SEITPAEQQGLLPRVVEAIYSQGKKVCESI
ncbi:MAG: hypothetical protein JWN98_2699, partial [Abditibacteriota bacterium]|nr:hypothetical protein [Abditibacteriota bacterium]